MSSIQFTRPLNQIEQTKNIRIEKNQMFSLNVSRKTSGTRLECFIFERVRLSLVIERSGTLYRKTRVEQNRPVDRVDPALKQPRRKMTTLDVKTEFTFMKVLYKITELFFK